MYIYVNLNFHTISMSIQIVAKLTLLANSPYTKDTEKATSHN